MAFMSRAFSCFHVASGFLTDRAMKAQGLREKNEGKDFNSDLKIESFIQCLRSVSLYTFFEFANSFSRKQKREPSYAVLYVCSQFSR